MIVVYVKHYLDAKGINYFEKDWFPYVEKIINEQPGFMGIEAGRDNDDKECINMTVKFDNMEKLMAWVANEKHAEVIDNLDVYRTRPQRWVVTEGTLPPDDLEKWDKAPLPEVSPYPKR